MSDQITELLEHYATQVTAAAVAPPAPMVSGTDHGWRRRYVLPAVAASAVVAIAVGVLAVSNRTSHRHIGVYSTNGAELGTAALPIDVTGRSSIAAARPTATATGPADLLAIAKNRKGTAALLAQHYSDGGLCLFVGYLRPALNMGSTWWCDPHGRVGWPSQPIVLMGEGPSGAPGGIKDPEIAYGSAPIGTRRLELSSAGVATVAARAYDGGPGYGHRAFFMATWSLAVRTSARALDEHGRVLAEFNMPFHPPTADMVAALCGNIRGALRGHFQRAIALSMKTRGPSAGRPRRTPAVQDASTDAGAGALFAAAIHDVTTMSAEERYEYRLAANVVTGETQCFTAASLRAVALHYLAVSR